MGLLDFMKDDKPMKPRELVERDDRGDPACDYFIVDPDVMYPKALAHTKKMLDGTEATPMYLAQEITAARALPPDAWELAMSPKADVAEFRHADRATALEHARRVFTALLREQNGAPIGLRILKGFGRFRL